MILSICGFDVDLDKIASMNFDVDNISLNYYKLNF